MRKKDLAIAILICVVISNVFYIGIVVGNIKPSDDLWAWLNGTLGVVSIIVSLTLIAGEE